jgi:hypothetical protein
MDHHSSKELFYDARLHIKSSYSYQRIHQIARAWLMVSKETNLFSYIVLFRFCYSWVNKSVDERETVASPSTLKSVPKWKKKSILERRDAKSKPRIFGEFTHFVCYSMLLLIVVMPTKYSICF